MTDYPALLAVLAATGSTMYLAVVAESLLNEKISTVLSRIIAIILVGLSAQYITYGMAIIDFVTFKRPTFGHLAL